MRTRLCVCTWSVRVQIRLPCCVYAGSFMEFQCFEVKPEDDSKEITVCSYDDKPSTGMFSVFCFLMRKLSALVFYVPH